MLQQTAPDMPPTEAVSADRGTHLRVNERQGRIQSSDGWTATVDIPAIPQLLAVQNGGQRIAIVTGVINATIHILLCAHMDAERKRYDCHTATLTRGIMPIDAQWKEDGARPELHLLTKFGKTISVWLDANRLCVDESSLHE